MSSDVLVGRQPIYDANLNVAAYELLFRSKQDNNTAQFSDGDKATSELILNTFLDIGLENIVGNLPAYINLTRSFITDPTAIPFAKENIVLEILEEVSIDNEVSNAIKSLHERGFTLALDDYIFDQRHSDILNYIDIIKIDILDLNNEQLQNEVKKLSQFKGKLLAEKIETLDEFEFCKSLNFDYYQGFFLSKPKIISGKRVPANRLTVLSIISKLYSDKTDIDDIKKDILTDVSLSYRLLRYLNSSYFNLARKIETIDDALIYLGLDNIKRWITLISLSSMSDKPNDIINTSLIRAKMCELLAQDKGLADPEQYFTAGLFSNLPALLDMSIEEILKPMPLTDALKNALSNYTGPIGKTLQFCINYEQINWDNLISINTETDTVKKCYLESIRWANDIIKELSSV